MFVQSSSSGRTRQRRKKMKERRRERREEARGNERGKARGKARPAFPPPKTRLEWIDFSKKRTAA